MILHKLTLSVKNLNSVMDYSVPIVEEHFSKDSCRLVTGQLKHNNFIYNYTQVSLNNLSLLYKLIYHHSQSTKSEEDLQVPEGTVYILLVWHQGMKIIVQSPTKDRQ